MWAWLGGLALHNLKRFLGVLVYALIFAGLAWSVYVTVVRPHTKPTPTSSQEATTIINNNYNCKALIGWGCNGKKQ